MSIYSTEAVGVEDKLILLGKSALRWLLLWVGANQIKCTELNWIFKRYNKDELKMESFYIFSKNSVFFEPSELPYNVEQVLRPQIAWSPVALLIYNRTFQAEKTQVPNLMRTYFQLLSTGMFWSL